MARERGERRLQFTLAIVAALAVVLGAVIGVGGSYLATRQQIASQTHALERQAAQSKEDYLRTQRRTAYASLIRQTKAFDKLQSRIEARLRSRDPGTWTRRQVAGQGRDLDRFDAMLRTLDFSHTNVQIVGSTVVLGPADNIALVQHGIGEELWKLDPYGETSWTHVNIIPTLNRMRAQQKAALQGFVDAAREDLVESQSS